MSKPMKRGEGFVYYNKRGAYESLVTYPSKPSDFRTVMGEDLPTDPNEFEAVFRSFKHGSDVLMPDGRVLPLKDELLFP